MMIFDGIISKYGKKKVYWFFLIMYCAVSFINVGLNYIEATRFKEGVVYKGIIDVEEGNSFERTVRFNYGNDQHFKFWLDEHSSPFFRNAYMIYEGIEVEKIYVDGSLEMEYYADGELIYSDDGFRVIGGSGSYVDEAPELVKIMRGAEEVYDYIYSVGIVSQVIAFSILMGLLLPAKMVYTKETWILGHFITVEGGEPTEFYLTYTKLSSMFLMIVTQAAIIIWV